MRRRTLFGLAPALSIALLAGCGGGFPEIASPGGPTPNPGGPTPAPTPTPIPGAGGRLDLSGGAPVGTVYFSTNYGRSATDQGKDQIFAMRSDGSGRTLIAESNSAAGSTGLFFTTLSPDGKFIVYGASGVGSENQNAFLAKADGSGKRAVVSGGYANALAFTADGQRLAYIARSLSGGSQSVFVENIDGTGQRTVATGTFASNTLATFALSPSGTKIAAGGDAGLFVENLDGSARAALAGTEFTVSGVSFSPDGSRVAVALEHRTDAARSGLYVLNADGSTNLAGASPIATKPPKVGASPFGNTIQPEGWSRDGKLIYSTSDQQNGDSLVDFYEWLAIDPDGSNRRSLARWAPTAFTNINDVGAGVLSPDGTQLVYSSGQFPTSQLYRVPVSGGGPQALTSTAKGDNFQPVFNGDGTRITFLSSRDDRGDIPGGQGGSGRGTLYIMNADGSGQTRLIDGFSTDRPEAFRKKIVGGTTR